MFSKLFSQFHCTHLLKGQKWFTQLELHFDILDVGQIANEGRIMIGIIPIPRLHATVVIVKDPLQCGHIVIAQLLDEIATHLVLELVAIIVALIVLELVLQSRLLIIQIYLVVVIVVFVKL